MEAVGAELPENLGTWAHFVNLQAADGMPGIGFLILPLPQPWKRDQKITGQEGV